MYECSASKLSLMKKASDPTIDGCGLPSGCWKLNAGSLEKYSVLLTTKPILQPQIFKFL